MANALELLPGSGDEWVFVGLTLKSGEAHYGCGWAVPCTLKKAACSYKDTI